jgi:asparagine synthase (glutamine-hydrolysing)
LDFKIKRTLRGLSFSEDLWAPVWMGPLEPKELNELFQEKVNLDEIYSEAIDAWDSCSQPDPVSRTQQFFIKLYLQDCILTKADRASMLNSLEVRCPFLDINLVNFARRIPARWKLYRGQTKWILKRALAAVLPPSIVKRRKKGFGIPVGRWFKENTLIELSERRQTYARFRANFYDRKLAEHRANLADHRLYLWSGWMLNQWLAR